MERKTKHFNHQKKSNSVDQNKYDENELKELNFAISPPKIN